MEIHVTDLDIPELMIYRALNENQLRKFYEPEPGIFICESEKVISRALDAGYEPLSVLMAENMTGESAACVLDRCSDIPVYLAEEGTIKELTGFALTGGILCAMRRKTLPVTQDIVAGRKCIAVLDDVENPTNVGAIFRSAAALGIEAVLLTHGCADPLYRRAARVSMGTVFQIPWTFCGRSEDVNDTLHDAGFTTIAMALSENASAISDPRIKSAQKRAIFLGNEGYGLRPDTVSECDIIAKIPMSPGIDSLNVAAASAVAFWEIGKDRI